MKSAIMRKVMQETLIDKIKDLEKQAILSALEECGWVQTRAARRLGITDRMIGYRIKKYRIAIKEVGKEGNQLSAAGKRFRQMLEISKMHFRKEMKMKTKSNISLILVLMCMVLAVSAITVNAEETGASGNASVGVFNKYVFRGYELSAGSIVVQPSAGISYKGFSASFWGNIDSEENPTQNYVPDRPDERSFNETDLTLSYTYAIDKLSLTGGYIYYGTKYAAETEELFLTAGYDTLLSPTLSVYRDITEYPGTYVNIAVAHSLSMGKEITLDLGASAGYFMGDNDYWNTFERSTGDYTGDEYKAFHDGMVKAGLTVPLAENISVQPVVQYWFPLSGKAKKTIDGSAYNINGKLDDTVVAGVNITLSF